MKILGKTDTTHQMASRANKARADYLANYGPQATNAGNNQSTHFVSLKF